MALTALGFGLSFLLACILSDMIRGIFEPRTTTQITTALIVSFMPMAVWTLGSVLYWTGMLVFTK